MNKKKDNYKTKKNQQQKNLPSVLYFREKCYVDDETKQKMKFMLIVNLSKEYEEEKNLCIFLMLN